MPGIFVFLLALFFFPPLGALAHIRTVSDAGLSLFWVYPNLSMRGNPTNSSQLSSQDVSSQLSAAFGAWAVPGSSASLSFSQSTSNPLGSNMDGVNGVYFSSAAGRNMDYGVVALTEVLYYVSSGQIVEADIVFNDSRFLFTNKEGDTGKNAGGKTSIFLQDVATHEAGHALGLDHSIVNLSSLVYTAFSGQYSLSADDRSAVKTAYPSSGAKGSARGAVYGKNGGIFGTHVVAINLETGKAEAGTLAGTDGSFQVGDLPPGQYAFLMEPFSADIRSISSYFQNINHRFCSGSQRFRRRFYSACGSSSATVIQVDAGKSPYLGGLAPSCSQMGNPEKAPSSISNAADFSARGGAKFGTLRAGESHYYKIKNGSGKFVARAMGYALYSPLDLRVEILQGDGSTLANAVVEENVENPMPGGFINYDSKAEATLAPGDYLLKIQAAPKKLFSSVFPAGFDLMDSDGHYLLALSVDGDFSPSPPTDMTSCISVSNTTQRGAIRAPASREEEDSVSGCGSLGGGGPGNSGLMQILFAVGLVHLFFFLRRPKTSLVYSRQGR